jgi:hypothetical protein
MPPILILDNSLVLLGAHFVVSKLYPGDMRTALQGADRVFWEECPRLTVREVKKRKWREFLAQTPSW